MDGHVDHGEKHDQEIQLRPAVPEVGLVVQHEAQADGLDQVFDNEDAVEHHVKNVQNLALMGSRKQ